MSALAPVPADARAGRGRKPRGTRLRWALGGFAVLMLTGACGTSPRSDASTTVEDESRDESHGASHDEARLAPASIMGQPDRPIVGPQGGVGQFVVECELSHVAADDPIIFPGQPGASHLHAFFGSTAVDADSSPEDLLKAPTSCDDARDTAAYWVPVLMDGGRVVAPTFAVAYYRAGLEVEPETVRAYPHGLVMIAGDPRATAAQPVSVVAWSCGHGSRREVLPPDCPPGASLRLDVTFPDCWDGINTDVPGHRDHLRYSNSGSCPTSHPVPLPQLVLSVVYPLSGDVSRMRLASGSLLSGHADFMNAWDQDALEGEVDLCIRRQNVCRISSGRLPN